MKGILDTSAAVFGGLSIAQVDPSGSQLLVWLGCFGFLVMLLNNTASLINHLRRKPSPKEIEDKFNQELKDIVLKTATQLEESETKILKKIEQEKTTSALRRKSIYEKLESIDKATAVQATEISNLKKELYIKR